MKNHKSVRALLITAVLMGLTVLTACQQTEQATAPPEEGTIETLDVAFVLPGVISDGAFVTQAYYGIMAAEELPWINTTYVENVFAPADGAKAIRDFATEGYDVVWAHSGGFASAILEIAPDFPDTVFVALTSPGADNPDNVWFSGGQYEDAFFTAGALAGLMTETNTLGYIGGSEYPLYTACAMAFEEGARYTNPDTEVFITFTGDFNDPIAGKEAGIGQIEMGADIIIHSMNLGSFGLFEAAEEAGNVWVIGKDIDQMPLAPDVVLTSVILDYQQQYPIILERIAAGETSGFLPMDLTTGTVYFAPYYGRVPDDIATQVEEIKAKVIAGELEYTTQSDLWE